MSAPSEGGNGRTDPAAGQALPADAPAPDAAARVGEVAPPPRPGDADAPASAGFPAPGDASDTGSPASGPTGQAQIDNLIASLPIDQELIERKPEILVAGAFAGAFLVAKIVRRIGG